MKKAKMALKNNKSPHSRTPRTTRKLNTLEAKKTAEPTNRTQRLTVVGIGASAGGLTALNSFFDALQADTGMAFVVVTHLHPTYESHLAEILQKHTQMPTHQVTRRMKVEANHVYVIPPNRSILMTDTHLETVAFTEPRGRRSPIDYFFRSLASEGREAIAIILSGGGTDGSVGIKDVKELGGVIMVQHPNEAEYDSMPLAAINTGLADVVLPAGQLAAKLMEYVQHRPQLPHDPGQLSAEEAETFQRILSHVHARTGQDFNQYKHSTILRRVERRMQLNGFTTLAGYLSFLRQNPNESQSMFNDILIGVTNFFRDQDSWLALEKDVIPALFEMKDGDEIRVWSIGCATGEEAYGLAMLLIEKAARLELPPHFQIFASDLDERSVVHAREGLYPAAIEADVSPERLERFFLREGEYYRIKHEVRDRVLFTNHNILRDPPFSHQDLIACRNLLIYLQREVQDKVFDIFHYALNPGGYVFLGGSETLEHLPELFQVVDKTHRIYQAKPWHGERPHVAALPLTMHRGRRSTGSANGTHPRTDRYPEEPRTFEEQHEKTLESHGPPSVIIDENHMILHVSETAGRFLLQPRGPLTGDVLKLVRPELQLELRTAIFQAFGKDRSIVSKPVYVQFNGHPHRVVIAVRPRMEGKGLGRSVEKQALILFLENELDESVDEITAQARPLSDQAEQNMLVAQLQSENQHLREQLQVTIEEYDSSNEEMKASNEQLQSINEEYRSATEELETSKDERTHELNEANQKISQARDLFFKLFHANPIPTSLTQLTDGTFLDVNDAYLQFAGRSREDLIGRTSLELELPLSKEIRPQIIKRLKKERVLNNIELQVQQGTGERVTFLASIQLISIDQTDALLMSFMDISERVRAEQQVRSLAYELTKAEQAERQRISQMLHDDLQQCIFSAKVQTIGLDNAYREGDLEAARKNLEQIRSLLDESISMTRNLSIDLSPAVLQGEGLTDALTWLASQMRELYGLNVSIEANGVSTLFEDTLRILLFQAIREALFNVVKHAATLDARITLKKTNGHIQITVSDDGDGFESASGNEENNPGGLARLKRRLDLMGCQLLVQSQPGKGTRVKIQIPTELVVA